MYRWRRQHHTAHNCGCSSGDHTGGSPIPSSAPGALPPLNNSRPVPGSVGLIGRKSRYHTPVCSRTVRVGGLTVRQCCCRGSWLRLTASLRGQHRCHYKVLPAADRCAAAAGSRRAYSSVLLPRPPVQPMACDRCTDAKGLLVCWLLWAGCCFVHGLWATRPDACC